MNHDEFEACVNEVMDSLPQWVHDGLDNLEVLVLDYAGELPDVIYMFRLPHLEMGLPLNELREEIAKTLIHEIAHYFGIDDGHLDEIGWG